MATYRIEVKTGEKDANGVTPTQIVELDLDNLTPLVFNSRFEFPSVGDVRHLYIATDENKIYRYDAIQIIYKCIGSDYNDINVIDCGGA
jgi:hypothetical protein